MFKKSIVRKTFLIYLSFCVIGAKAMMSPEISSRLGTGLLTIGTNSIGYIAHDVASSSETNHTDARNAFIWGLRSTWLTANINLLRSLIFKKSIAATAARSSTLCATSFATNFLCLYLDSKAAHEQSQSRFWEPVCKGFRGALWTTGFLVNCALLYESIVGK
jgi:hypothetical protein